MSLPGHRRTSSHKRRRASHFALKKHQFATCSHCKGLTAPHKVCVHCGYYNGKQVVNKAKKAKAKQKAS